MADPEEQISLKDRYESLKVLCSEQVMANELLKEELNSARKGFKEVSQHRAFLLEKLISLQSRPTQSPKQHAKKHGVSPVIENNQNRNNQPQRNKVASNRLPIIQRSEAYSRDSTSVDKPELESEFMHGEFDNGWEDVFHHMGVTSYRRPQAKNLKRQWMLPPTGPPSFKRSRNIKEPAGPSSSGDFIQYRQPEPSHSSMGGARTVIPFDFADNCTDMSEEPPIIYSKGAGFPSGEVPKRVNSNNLKTSSLMRENTNDRSLFQKPQPVSGGYFDSRFH